VVALQLSHKRRVCLPGISRSLLHSEFEQFDNVITVFNFLLSGEFGELNIKEKCSLSG